LRLKTDVASCRSLPQHALFAFLTFGFFLGDIYGAFVRRFHAQFMQLKSLLLQVLGAGHPSPSQQAGLVRDAFGLHKMIVAVTDSGKVFGIDNISGKYHWIVYLPQFGRFNEAESLKLLVQRTSKFYPLPAQCVIVGRNKANGNGILYHFDPMNGKAVGGGVVELDYQIKQLSLLHEAGGDYLKGLLVLDQNDVPHALPQSYAKAAKGTYLFTADKNTGVMTGFVVDGDDENKLATTKTWQLNLGGGLGNSQKIVNIAARNPVEHVHSQGRVLADRSVLYKYLNPNLVAVTTHGPDAIHKCK
jgi:ER membrane protein complex subunit 1